jgi:glutaredoxin
MYSKPNCQYCFKAEHLLKKFDIEIEKKILGEDISVDDFKNILPEARSVPQIYLYNNSEKRYIGGYVELLKELENAEPNQ